MFARVRYLVLAMLALLSVVTYMDRICISVAAREIKAELGIDEKSWGWIFGAFLLSYGLFEIPTGAWGDRLGQRRVLTRIVVWWSGFTMLTGIAQGYWTLLVTRLLFGAGEAGAYPNAAGSVGHWFPPQERARAQSVVWSASRLGGAVTPLLVVPMMSGIGWRNTFLVFGAVGFLWAIAWRIWYRDRPAEHASVTDHELAEIGAPAQFDHSAIPWGRLVRSPQLWVIMAMYFTYAWGPIFYMTWLPEYLTKGRGMGSAAMAVFTAIPFLCGAFGNLAGGFLSDQLTATRGARVGRRVIGSLCLALSAVCLLAAAVIQHSVTAAAVLCVGFGIIDGMLPCAWAVCLDVGGRCAGAVSGSMNMAGQAGGFVCTVLFGYLVQWYTNYSLPLYLIAAMVFISAWLFWQIDPTRPLVVAEAETGDGESGTSGDMREQHA